MSGFINPLPFPSQALTHMKVCILQVWGYPRKVSRGQDPRAVETQLNSGNSCPLAWT